jgi:hypothetical protein
MLLEEAVTKAEAMEANPYKYNLLINSWSISWDKRQINAKINSY